jgi:hypothetical protein
MRNSVAIALLAVSALHAQGPEVQLDPRSSFRVNLPADAPVSFVSADWGQSKASSRGGALLVDLHSTLQLKNSGTRPIRGVSLLVLAQEVTPGGRASVTVPSLDINPGETFPVRIDLRLLRPLAAPGVALVEVSLDGVLFDDLAFYGPDKLKSRRAMLAWEMEARRDRKHFLALLDAGGPVALRKEMILSLNRQADSPRLDIQMARAGRATNAADGQPVQFAFLKAPDSPVELLAGAADVLGNEVRAPRIEIENRSKRPVRYLEVSWLVRDPQGREYAAGAVPGDVTLAPGARGSFVKEGALRFSQPGGAPLAISGITGVLRSVEFADGNVWVPAHPDEKLGPSPEEQRLSDLYRRKGIDAVIQQLKKLR